MTEAKSYTKKLALIRVRGGIGLKKDVIETLERLRLYRKNFCVVIPDTACNLGMIKKVKDHITWGEISDDVYKLLVDKRGEEYKGRTTDAKGKVEYHKFIEINKKLYKPFFRLSPPRKGYGRKGIKVSFNLGGALGDRGKKINDIIQRMI